MIRSLILPLTLCAISATAHAQQLVPASAPSAEGPNATFVTGIGGFFFRAEDPEALEAWYHDNLGITLPPQSYDDQVWQQQAGTTIFHPFPKDSPAFGDDAKQFMLNFRVSDIDAAVAHLQANGNEVELDPATYPNGRFAMVKDPEGNPIQLWQPSENASE